MFPHFIPVPSLNGLLPTMALVTTVQRNSVAQPEGAIDERTQELGYILRPTTVDDDGYTVEAFLCLFLKKRKLFRGCYRQWDKPKPIHWLGVSPLKYFIDDNRMSESSCHTHLSSNQGPRVCHYARGTLFDNQHMAQMGDEGFWPRSLQLRRKSR